MNKADSLMERLELVRLARLNEPPEDGLSASLRELYESMEPGELERLEVTLGEAFCAWPGDLVHVQRAGWGWNGRYRAVQVTVGMDRRGYWTKMELARPDFVV